MNTLSWLCGGQFDRSVVAWSLGSNQLDRRACDRTASRRVYPIAPALEPRGDRDQQSSPRARRAFGGNPSVSSVHLPPETALATPSACGHLTYDETENDRARKDISDASSGTGVAPYTASAGNRPLTLCHPSVKLSRATVPTRPSELSD